MIKIPVLIYDKMFSQDQNLLLDRIEQNGFFSLCSTLKRRPGSPSSFLLALLITRPWRSLEAPYVMLFDSLSSPSLANLSSPF